MFENLPNTQKKSPVKRAGQYLAAVFGSAVVAVVALGYVGVLTPPAVSLGVQFVGWICVALFFGFWAYIKAKEAEK